MTDAASKHGPGLTPEQRDAVLAALPQPAKVYKDDARSRVVRVDAADGSWVVKTYRTPAWKMPLYRLLGISPGQREMRSAGQLANTGVRFAEPAALVPGSGGEEHLILPRVEGEPLYVLLYWSEPASTWTPDHRRHRTRLARAVGRQAGALTSSGLVNRDHKPSNILIDPACEQGGGVAQPVLIDLPGIRRLRSPHQVDRMLANLYVSSEATWNIPLRECLACLRGVIETDPGIAVGDTPRAKRRVLLDRVKRVADALPRSSRETRGGALPPRNAG